MPFISLWRVSCLCQSAVHDGVEFSSINQLYLYDGASVALRTYAVHIWFSSDRFRSRPFLLVFFSRGRRIFEAVHVFVWRPRQRGEAIPLMYASATLPSSSLTTRLSEPNLAAKNASLTPAQTRAAANATPEYAMHVRLRIRLHHVPSSVPFSTD